MFIKETVIVLPTSNILDSCQVTAGGLKSLEVLVDLTLNTDTSYCVDITTNVQVRQITFVNTKKNISKFDPHNARFAIYFCYYYYSG